MACHLNYGTRHIDSTYIEPIRQSQFQTHVYMISILMPYRFAIGAISDYLTVSEISGKNSGKIPKRYFSREVTHHVESVARASSTITPLASDLSAPAG